MLQARNSQMRLVIYGILIFAGCFLALFTALLAWIYFNSYHEDTVQELTSPDGRSVLIIKLNTEDDPYYVFELEQKTWIGGAKFLGACQLQWKGPDYSVSRWEGNKRFLLHVRQDNKLVKTVSIDTEHPVFPCLAPGETIDSLNQANTSR
jgi:hypothetical protein